MSAAVVTGALRVKGNGYNFMADYSICFSLPSEKGSIPKIKEFSPHGSQFVSFTVDPIYSRGLICKEANRKSQKLSFLKT